MSSFANRMVELRIEKGLKKVDVSRGTKLDRSAITKYESGERDNPTRSILNRLADFYNVSIDYLSGNSDIKDKDVSSRTLDDVFNKLNDSNKIELVKYAKYLLKEQEDGERISD